MIMTNLLANMFEPRRLTHILYSTNLSYGQLKKYLTSLQRMGLAEELSEPYRAFRTTDKGRAFIQLIAIEHDSIKVNP